MGLLLDAHILVQQYIDIVGQIGDLDANQFQLILKSVSCGGNWRC